MAEEFKTTFIPKKPLAQQDIDRSAPSKPMGLFTIISTLFFLVAILLAVGAYVYLGILQNTKEEANLSLERARAAFDTGLIQQMQNLDTRLRAGSQIIENHIAVSPLFVELEENTLRSIRFTDFTFNESNGVSSMELGGEAASFTAIAQQSDIFGESRFFKKHIFSDFQTTRTGTVQFGLNVVVDTDELLYIRNLGQTAGVISSQEIEGFDEVTQ